MANSAEPVFMYFSAICVFSLARCSDLLPTLKNYVVCFPECFRVLYVFYIQIPNCGFLLFFFLNRISLSSPGRPRTSSKAGFPGAHHHTEQSFAFILFCFKHHGWNPGEKYWSGPSGPSSQTYFSAQRRFICLTGAEGRETKTNKGDRGLRRKGKGRKGRGRGYLSLRDKGLPLGWEEMGKTHGKNSL